MSKTQLPSYIWEGVYETLEDAKVEGTGFASDRWMERIRGQLLNYREECKSHSLAMPPRMSDLPMLAAVTGAKRIVDFGGSSGWTYNFLQAAVPQNTIEDYIVVEMEEVVRHMQLACLHAEPVSYTSEMPCGEGGVDIFYTNSALQYIYDDAVVFNAIEQLQPTYLLVEDFLGGDFDDYYSLQNYYESRIPIRFRNRRKFINSLYRYDVVLSKPYITAVLGVIQELPMKNFPEDKRVRYAETLLLKRKEK